MENVIKHRLLNISKYVTTSYAVPRKTKGGQVVTAENAYYSSSGREYLSEVRDNSRVTPEFSANSISYDEENNVYVIEDIVKTSEEGETVTIFITLDENGHQVGFISNNILEGYSFDEIFTGNLDESTKNYQNYKRELIEQINLNKSKKQATRKENILKFTKTLHNV